MIIKYIPKIYLAHLSDNQPSFKGFFIFHLYFLYLNQLYLADSVFKNSLKRV